MPAGVDLSEDKGEGESTHHGVRPLLGRRTINKEHRWWGVLPGPQATPHVVLLRVRVRKKEPRKYSERGRRCTCMRARW